MKVVKPVANLLRPINREEILHDLEVIGRVAYKSEDKITEKSAASFIEMIVKRGHMSVIEHKSITVHVICDRGVSHEWVRHRLAAYTQESTRYCNYSKDKHDKQVTFIEPEFMWCNDQRRNSDEIGLSMQKQDIWENTMQNIEDAYLAEIELGATPQAARSLLPNSLKTEFYVTMNLRAWHHFFVMRTAEGAHPQMREIAVPLLVEFQKALPEIYGKPGSIINEK